MTSRRICSTHNAPMDAFTSAWNVALQHPFWGLPWLCLMAFLLAKIGGCLRSMIFKS
jgi:hypothetical protein